MTTTVFLFHPDTTASRVNAALADAARTADFEVRDLYQLYPDGSIDIDTEQAALSTTDTIVLQFPMYWYSTPPLLKKWQDDVLTHGWAYGSTGTALHGKTLLAAVSTGSPARNYTADGAFGYTVAELLRPLEATSNLVGTQYLPPFVTSGALTISDEDLAAAAAAYVERLKTL